MAEISAASLAVQRDTSLLALKLQQQQDAAIVNLVTQVVQSSKQALESAPPASDKLVDIVV
jgi:hypothetical protein